MKKLLTGVLTVFAFIGITGCSNEKKMSAKDAETTIKAAAQNTQKKLETTASLKITDSVKGSLEANNVNLLKGDQTLLKLAEKAKVGVDLTTNETISYNKTEKKGKIAADADAKVDLNITSDVLSLLGFDSPMKSTYTAKANGEAYYIDGASQANIYAKYDATLNDQAVKDFGLESSTLTGKYNFKTVEFMGLIDKIDFDGDTSTTIDGFIKDWTIFKKKGKTIIADCSNMEAFDLGEDFKEMQKDLKELGVEFKVSKLEFELNKDKTIKDIDFALGVNGNVDLSKTGFDNESWQSLAGAVAMFKPELAALAILPVDGLSGTMTLNFDLAAGLEFNYSPEAITVSDELKAVEEKDLDEMIGGLFLGLMGGMSAATGTES